MHKILFHNKFYFMPLHVSSTCVHHQEVRIVLHSLWYHQTGMRERALSTRQRDGHRQVWWYQRLCNTILTSWWWTHVLETCRGMKWNLLWNKFCASSWLNTEIDILRCTVSKTSKKKLFRVFDTEVRSVSACQGQPDHLRHCVWTLGM